MNPVIPVTPSVQFGACQEFKMNRRPDFSTGRPFMADLPADELAIVEEFAAQDIVAQERRKTTERAYRDGLDDIEGKYPNVPEEVLQEQLGLFRRRLQRVSDQIMTLFSVDGRYFFARDTRHDEDASEIGAIRAEGFKRFANKPEQLMEFLAEKYRAFVQRRQTESPFFERPVYYTVTPEGEVVT